MVKRSGSRDDSSKVKKRLLVSLVLGLFAALLVLAPTTTASAAPAATARVVTGADFACALSTSGQTYCWGANSNGQLGNNSTIASATPVTVSQASNLYVTISAGAEHVCGLTAAGLAYCWGQGTNGELGNNATSNSSVPVAVQQGAVRYTQIGTGFVHTCALSTAGQTYCFGWDGNGRLGDGNLTGQSAVPVAVGQSGVVYASLSVGGFFGCGMTSAGQAYCWGLNNQGELGNNTNTPDSGTPVMVQQGGLVFASIYSGNGYNCGLTSGGQAYCWGYNGNGQNGDYTQTAHWTPSPVQQGGVVFASIVLALAHTCGLTSAGAAYCWGYNAYGELGNNTQTQELSQVTVSGGLTFSFLSASNQGNDTCGVLSNSQLYCWGSNSAGQLGDMTTTDRWTPTRAVFPGAAASSTASVTIDPTFTFAVSSHSGACNGVSQTSGATGSPSAVALGHLASGATVFGAQDLTVTTNAGNGYTVLISSASPTMSDGHGHAIAAVTSTNTSPAAFPSAGTAGYGYTTSDSTLGTGTANRFTSPSATFAALASTGSEVSYNANPATADVVCVGFEVGASASTAAAAYTSTVVYTAVPTF